jgi:hypothetical protein
MVYAHRVSPQNEMHAICQVSPVGIKSGCASNSFAITLWTRNLSSKHISRHRTCIRMWLCTQMPNKQYESPKRPERERETTWISPHLPFTLAGPLVAPRTVSLHAQVVLVAFTVAQLFEFVGPRSRHEFTFPRAQTGSPRCIFSFHRVGPFLTRKRCMYGLQHMTHTQAS